MNANRSKYTDTPAFGIQRHGLFAKATAAGRTIPETPDFSQTPPETTPQISSPVFSAASQQGQTMPYAFPNSASFPQGTAIGQPATFYAQSTQTPYQMMNPYTGQIQYPPMYSVPPVNTSEQFPNKTLRQPLRQEKVQPFTGAVQGYVPTNTQGNPVPSYVPSSPFGGVAMNGMGSQGMGYGAGIQAPLQQNYGYQPMPGGVPQPGSVRQSNVPQPSAQIPSQQNADANFYPIQQPSAKPSASGDRAWSVLLFGLIPALFLLCVFFAQTLPVIPILYAVFCIIGLAVMWYKRLFSTSTRMVLSMVYAALAIVAISLLTNTVGDRTTSVPNPKDTQDVYASSITPAPVNTEDLLVNEASVTPSPVPVSIKSAAELRLETFMNLWTSNNTTDMVKYVQPSWVNSQSDPPSALFMVLANRTAEKFTIEDISGSDEDNSRTVTMRATINKNNGKASVTYRFMVMMVREGDEWYVNPNSLATNEEVTTTEDEVVVNNKNATTGLATEPPRTTVTPAPPGDTLLYYNENGGNYYHIDPYCPSIASKYLPLTGSFPYRDLASKKKELNLSPCLKCKAPTSVLPSDSN